MITRSELRSIILSEVAQARSEVAARKPASLTRERIREIVLEEAAALKGARHSRLGGDMMITSKLSLVEAIMGDDLEEAGPGIILSRHHDEGSTCMECGAMYETPVAKCQHCGASMEEYVSRGMTNMGRLKPVSERRKHKSMSSGPVTDDPSDLGGMSRDTAKSMVAKMGKAPGPTFSNIVHAAEEWADNPAAYAGSLMRTAGLEPARGPRKSKKKG